MSKHTFVELEPRHRQEHHRARSERQFEKTELNDVAGHSMLVLATSVANAVILGMEMRERQKLRRSVLIIVSGLVVAIGLFQLTMSILRG